MYKSISHRLQQLETHQLRALKDEALEARLPMLAAAVLIELVIRDSEEIEQLASRLRASSGDSPAA